MLNKHKKIERNSFWLLVLSLVVISIGGLVEIVPLFRIETTIEKVEGMRPYTPLELAGQQIYIRENCSACHSQQIRPLRDEVERYGHYSLAAESMYDHPFLWGSKRTGPDLARVGGKYSDQWHVAHLINPRDVVPESIMPGYSYMLNKGVDTYEIKDLMKAMKTVGVPYTQAMIENARQDIITQAIPGGDATELKKRYGNTIIARDFDGQDQFVSEMDALIAYLQVLGTMVDINDYDIKQIAKEAK
ncbi:MAG: cytochrome-c oxidase, cbb3-type subunit II [Alphaproteobacteria bacterium]|nr:cytochrome-c oxidase, cbb3-type subunit II [Alphaproteobacteria bacterium]